MKFALSALCLSLTTSTLSFAEDSIDTAAIMSGLKETKLIFSCDHPDAKVVFQVTKEARAEVMYTLNAKGVLVAEQGLQKSDKQCPNDTQIGIEDYCVQPMCIIKDVRPPIKKNKLSKVDANAAQLEQRTVSMDEIF